MRAPAQAGYTTMIVRDLHQACGKTDARRPPWRCFHFVGFRGDEFWSAVRIWGRPDFIHRRWDQRARREIAPGDTIIFATGTEGDAPARWNGDDIDEPVALRQNGR
jgi:hypothetical protein